MCVIFGEMLGIEYDVEYASCENMTLKLPNDKTIVFPDGLFGVPEAEWLSERSLPETPLSWFDSGVLNINPDMADPLIPVIYGDPSVIVNLEEGAIVCRIDVFGSIFFMLSRYEEYAVRNTDIHDRFPGSESTAFREGFVDKPVVNIYIELLWMLMKILCPGMERKQHHFSMVPTHDVDRPYEHYLLPFQRMVRTVASDIVRRKSVRLASRNLYQWGISKMTNGVKDVNNTFEYLMDESEKRSLVSRFFFIAGSGVPEPYFDRPYKIEHPEISRLMTEIHARGHEIGLHTSYGTYLSEEKTCVEMMHLKSHCQNLNIHQSIWGNRQHYLRWRNPDTQRNLDNCGVDYDSTAGFPDMAGFRSGTCCEYPVYDMLERTTLDLRERPLIAMDATFLRQLGEGRRLIDDCYDELCRLKRKCQDYGGGFTLLWHNSSLGVPEYRALYEAVLDA